MSDVMLFGVLRMPYEMAMGDDLSRFQFWQRAQEAADRISTDGVEINRLMALLSAAQPAPASTGREPIYQVQFVGEYASSVWHDATEDAYNTFIPERRRIVYAAPVAARELDVEAERREPPTLPRYLLDMIGEYGHARTDSVGQLEVQHRWETLIGGIKRYASDFASTAQGTQAESAPVSTEQAGDAWISVEDRLPEKECLAAYSTPNGKVRLIRAKYARKFQIEAEDDDCETEYNEDDDTFYIKEGWLECIDNWGEYSSCDVVEGIVTHWMPLPAAPSPNNSPVGADKEPK